MSDTLKTVTIKTENGPVVINETDYDPATHTLDGEEGPRNAPNSVTPAPAYNVAKMGKRYFVVDGAGNKIDASGIDPNGYDTDAAAWAAALPKPVA